MGDSTLPLEIIGTLAVHLIIAVVVDVASVVGRPEPEKPRQKLSLVDLDTRNVTPPSCSPRG